jgi:hypothetical protein
LIGNNPLTPAQPTARLTSLYYDFETAGIGSSGGSGVGVGTAAGQGKTTATLQAALQAGFNPVGSVFWGIVANTSFPYFLWQYAAAPQVVSGTAYTDRGTTALAGGAVNLLIGGTNFGAASTGNNGYYYFLTPGGTISGSGSQVLTYSTGANAGATFQENATGSLAGLNIDVTFDSVGRPRNCA